MIDIAWTNGGNEVILSFLPLRDVTLDVIFSERKNWKESLKSDDAIRHTMNLTKGCRATFNFFTATSDRLKVLEGVLV